MTMKREPSISEQQAREIVERMGRRESLLDGAVCPSLPVTVPPSRKSCTG